MGMYDDLKCKAPLPLAGANDMSYQSKDTPMQFLDKYEIREDGTLWHEEYEIADESDLAKWKKANPGKTPPTDLNGFIGCMTRVNKRWVQLDRHDGAINFYTTLGQHHTGWLQFKAVFVDGKLAKPIELVEYKKVCADKTPVKGKE